jgi:hypothetical protein
MPHRLQEGNAAYLQHVGRDPILVNAAREVSAMQPVDRGTTLSGIGTGHKAL